MSARKGIRRPLSAARKVVIELMHHARKVPSLPLAKTANVEDLLLLRKEQPSPSSWMAMFLKAYGLVCKNNAPLRQALIPFPWPHLYEHPLSEAGVLIERELDGEMVVLGAKIRGPENCSLAELDARLRWLKQTPVWEVSYFRQALRIGALPWPLRRLAFWQALNLSGYRRAKHLGTFLISSLGNFGVEQFHPLAPHTTYFTFGPISPVGDVTLRIVYDHRVMDGRTVARCLGELEEVLHGPIREELLEARPEPDYPHEQWLDPVEPVPHQ
jgi:hypothetical protein